MRKLFIALVLFFVLFLATKDFIATSLVLHLARKALGPSVVISRVKLSPATVAFQGVSFAYRGAGVSLKNGLLRLDWSRFPRPCLAGVMLDTLTLAVPDFASLQRGMKTGAPQAGLAAPGISFGPRGCEVMLRNVWCDIKGMGEASLKGVFSADIVVTEGLSFELKDIALEGVAIKGNVFELKDLSVRKTSGSLYELTVSLLTIKEKKIKDVRLGLRQEGTRLVIVPSTIDFLGADSQIEGAIDFTDLSQPCCDLRARGLSFTGLLGLVTDPKALDFEGTFTGSFRMCVSAQGLRELAAGFTNTAAGFIHLKNDSALDFMRPYVDQPSHKALVDNLKNYTYNESTVHARAENGVIIVDILFDSPAYGKRSITVALHNDG